MTHKVHIMYEIPERPMAFGAEVYIDGERVYGVREITCENTEGIEIHRDRNKVWVEFEAEVSNENGEVRCLR